MFALLKICVIRIQWLNRIFFAKVQNLEKVIDKAKKGFNKEIAKIQAFNDGAGFYLEKENYALTAFMVHQQIELAYRAIELFAMGKDKVTHSIRVHQNRKQGAMYHT